MSFPSGEGRRTTVAPPARRLEFRDAGWLPAPRAGFPEAAPLVFRKGDVMPLIKPRTRGKRLVKHSTRLDHENNETLYAYAAFLGEPTEYVLNQVIDTVLAKDKEFLRWRAEHPESFVPRGRGRRDPSVRSTNRVPVPVSSSVPVLSLSSGMKQ
jgi:hypothetical protein